MLKDITIGQYFPIDSKVHKLDPRIKLLYTLVYIVMVFVCNNFIALFASLLGIILLTVFAKIPFKTILKSLRPILLIILITSLLQIIYVKTGIVLFEYWRIKITSGGLLQALFMTTRVSLLIVMSSLFTYTTSPTAMTNGLDRIFSPLTKLGIDFNVVTMIMTIALRFIPTLIDEVDKIISAQKSRGANFESGNLLKRAKMLVPLFIPLLFNSIKRAYDLAYAMTCRCYNGGKGRTTMNALKFRTSDWIMLILTFAFIASVIVMNRFFGEYNAEFTFGITL